MDLVITNGRIIDGTGNPWFYGDLVILGEKIHYIGPSAGFATPALDAGGKIVAPGFIDIHTHSDFTVLQCPGGDSKVLQGVTTELAGHCGYSLVPVNSRYREGLKAFNAFMPGSLDWNWHSPLELLDRVEQAGPAANFITLIGHGTLRIAVMGFERRQASAKEMAEMNDLLASCLDQGGAGLSLGLVYAPGSFSTREELLSLARVVQSRHKLLTAHIRDEGDQVEEALQELLEIGEETGVLLQICHLKAQGRHNWDKMDRLFAMIEASREKGVDVTFDVYPYDKLNTLATALLPPWAQDGGSEKVTERLADRRVRQRLEPELLPIIAKYGGWDHIVVASCHREENHWAQGKSLQEIADEQEVLPADALLDLMVKDNCGMMLVCHCLSEANMIRALQHPLAMLGSDGKILSTTGPLANGKPHPRNFGAYPRFLGEYVRDRQVMSLEEAVRKMTSAPAQKLRLKERGLLREGMQADVVIFDEADICDNSTFQRPQQYPGGIAAVLVNGALTVNEGRLTGVRAGKVLRRA